MKDHKLWQGRAAGNVSDIMVEMGQSISLDIELFEQDIKGSLAHAAMLHKIKILNDSEWQSIKTGLEQIKGEIHKGQMDLRYELEDIHTHIENRLIELTGETGKKLHTARSRNDQIAVDTHLFVREESNLLKSALKKLAETILRRAENSIDIFLPGYTHLQVAQPVRLSHHLLAYFWPILRDIQRFENASITANSMPLGSGAMSGVNYATDRDFLKNELGFDRMYANSMDAVSSRDHILDFLYACSTFMVHMSRICEEIILWSSVEFQFITLPDSLTTGSSIMPQKKNPDLAELSRGKTGRITGNLINVIMSLKGLPLTYNRDLQEDRLPLLDTARETKMVSQAMTEMLAQMEVHKENMQKSLAKGFATATDLADALVIQKNVPFREAHHLSGALIRKCIEHDYTLQTIPESLRLEVSEHFSGSFYDQAISLTASTDKKISYGGTARDRQIEQLQEAWQALGKL